MSLQIFKTKTFKLLKLIANCSYLLMVIIILNPLFILAGFIWLEDKIKKYVEQNKRISISTDVACSQN